MLLLSNNVGHPLSPISKFVKRIWKSAKDGGGLAVHKHIALDRDNIKVVRVDIATANSLSHSTIFMTRNLGALRSVRDTYNTINIQACILIY